MSAPSDISTATAVFRLAKPLMTFLDANHGNYLDNMTRQCLLSVRTLIDRALSRDDDDRYHGEAQRGVEKQREKKEARACTIESNASSYARRVHNEHKDEAKGAQESSTESTNSWSSSSRTQLSSMVITKNVKILPANVSLEGSQIVGGAQTSNKVANELHERSHRHQTRRKRRVLLAVSPFQELTEEESAITVMLQFLGPAVNKWWFRNKRWLAGLYSLGLLWNVVAMSLFIFWPEIWEDVGWILAYGSWAAAVIFTFQYSSLLNAHVLRRCFRTFDGFFLMIETALFASSFWSLTCFTAPGLSLATNTFFLSLPYIFYDSYPAAARGKSRLFLLLGGASHLVTLVCLFQGRYVNQYRCYYRLDMFHGLTLLPSPGDLDLTGEHVVTVTPSLSPLASRWSISLFDFCMNRGATLLYLMLKIIYAVYQHPHYCAIIKTQMRLIDENIPEAADTPPPSPTLTKSPVTPYEESRNNESYQS